MVFSNIVVLNINFYYFYGVVKKKNKMGTLNVKEDGYGGTNHYREFEIIDMIEIKI